MSENENVQQQPVVDKMSLYGFKVREPDKRRLPPGQKRVWEAKRLWARHHEIINLAGMGYKNTEIAKLMNVHPRTVNNTLNCELGLEKQGEVVAERDAEAKKVREKIAKLTEQALGIYETVMSDRGGVATIKDKIGVANTVMLELSGHRVATKVQSHNINTNLTPDEINEFKERGKASMQDLGIVDVEAEEVGGNNGG